MKWEGRRQSCNIEDRRYGLEAQAPIKQYFNKLACEVKNAMLYGDTADASQALYENPAGALDASTKNMDDAVETTATTHHTDPVGFPSTGP